MRFHVTELQKRVFSRNLRMQFYMVECLTNCIFGHFHPSCLQILLKTSTLVNEFRINCSFMLLPFLKDHIYGNLSISYSTIMMIDYHSTIFLRKLLFLHYSENLHKCQLEIRCTQRHFKLSVFLYGVFLLSWQKFEN